MCYVLDSSDRRLFLYVNLKCIKISSVISDNFVSEKDDMASLPWSAGLYWFIVSSSENGHGIPIDTSRDIYSSRCYDYAAKVF